jgi:hypothetical protein
MPAAGRDRDEEIVTTMLAVLQPTAAERAALVRKLHSCIATMAHVAAHWPSSPAQRREHTRELQRYRRRLLAAERERPKLGALGQDGFPAALAAELARVQQLIRRGRPGDPVARTAARLVHDDLLTPAERTLTREGKWHRLASLLYEAGSGSDAHADKVLKYMAELKRGSKFRQPLRR